MEEFKERTVYQVMDMNFNYRSLIISNGEPLDFISKKRKEAIVYSFDDAKKVAKYYTDRKIPVMIECRTAKTKRQI